MNYISLSRKSSGISVPVSVSMRVFVLFLLTILSIRAEGQYPCGEVYPINPYITATSVAAVVPATFAWNDPCTTFSGTYQIQVLRLFNTDPTTASSPTTITTKVDWNGATSIVTDQSMAVQSFWLTLVEGTGYYVWRVRRVYTGNPETYGGWSDAGAFVDGATVSVTSSSTGTGVYLFYYTQFDDGLNWIFNRKVEDNERYNIYSRSRIAEKVTYANFLMMPIQEQTAVPVSGDVMASQTVPDNLGRPSLKTLPASLQRWGSSSFGYEYNFLRANSSGTTYTADDYDDQAHANAPELADNSNMVTQYYSDYNPDPTIPSAGNIPYSRTLYYNDGLGRPREVASPGPAHAMSSGHSVKKYYGKSTATELIRLFGDEAPKAESVWKNYTMDPNGVISIAYVDEFDRTIATCLTTPQSPLLDPLDVEHFVAYDTVRGKTQITPTRLMMKSTYAFAIPTRLDYIYEINPKVYKDACMQLCATCDYRIKITCRNRDDDEAWPLSTAYVDSFTVGPQIDSVTGSCGLGDNFHHSGTYKVPLSTLEPGTYDVAVTIELNNINPLTNQRYIDDLVEILHRKLDANFNSSSFDCQVLNSGGNIHAHIPDIKTYLNDNKIWELLIDYLKVDTNQQTFKLKVGCDTLILPTAHCPKPACDPALFAQYMKDYLTAYDLNHNTTFYANALANTTTGGVAYTTSTANGFIVTSDVELNNIFTSMLSELDSHGDHLYNCEDLWKAWKATIQEYTAEQVVAAGGLSIPLNTTTPKTDWWFKFMQKVGFKLAMEAQPSADLSNPSSLLRTKPYQYFAYDFGTNVSVETGFCNVYEQLIFATITPCVGSSSFTPAWYNGTSGLTDPGHNYPGATPQTVAFHMWNFYMAIKGVNSTASTTLTTLGAINPGATQAQMYAQMKDLCIKKCEARINEAVDQISQNLMDQGIKVNGMNYPSWSFPSTPYFNVDLVNVYCLAYGVVEKCKESCTLPAVTPHTIQDYENSMLASLNIIMASVPNPSGPGPGGPPEFSCLEPDVTVHAPTGVSLTHALQAWLKREYDRIRDSLVMSGCTLTYNWHPLDHAVSFGLEAYAPCSSATVEINQAFNMGCFILGTPTPVVDAFGGSAVASVTRTTPGKMLPNDDVEIKLELTIGAGGLPAGYSAEFFEAIPTSAAGTVTVTSSTGWYDAGLNMYRFKVTGPRAAGSVITFTYSIKTPNVVLPTTATIDMGGYVEVTNTVPSVINTYALTGDTIHIDCVDLLYGFSNGGMGYKVLCSICPGGDLGCEGSVCMNWDNPTGPAIPTELHTLTCEEVVSAETKSLFLQQLADIHTRHEIKLRQDYNKNCLDPAQVEDLWVNYFDLNEYQYTLYYYDRAGNLIRTVAPEGVKTGVCTDRTTNPHHDFTSQYDFNTLAQTVRTFNPDAGQSQLWYDSKGRIRFAQDSKQAGVGTFAYTKYDPLGRAIEGGETDMSAPVDPIADADNNALPSIGTNITKTTYSTPFPPTGSLFPSGGGSLPGGDYQAFLHNRVSYTETDRDGDWGTVLDQTRTVYSYDPHGNVDNLYQWVSGMPSTKLLRYRYSPVNGKTNMVELLNEDGSTDPNEHYQMLYKYNGNSELVHVALTDYTSLTHNDWFQVQYSEYIAHYDHYLHGPLKRMTLGAYAAETQGVDYTYTIEGWLKGINHSTSPEAAGATINDPGYDGGPGSTVPQDAFGMVLNYYDNDFTRSGSVFNSNVSNGYYLQGGPLYNGNISSWQQQIYASGSSLLKYEEEVGNKYRYDQLNRITKSYFNEHLKKGWTYTSLYDEYFSYDKNGNIQTLQRYADKNLIDDFKYTYTAGNNRLDNVADLSGNNLYDLVESKKFDYFANGNVKYDDSRAINANWTPANKLDNWSNGTGDEEDYLYDAMGNRARKFAKIGGTNTTEYYIHDATGNLMVVYEDAGSGIGIKERYLYGVDQLGVLDGPNTPGGPRMLPLPKFFLKDHLGNIRVVINENDPAAWTPSLSIASYNNYYAFGALQPERALNTPTGSRQGFNGQERSDAIGGIGMHNTALYWEYDTRYGRRWNLDPKFKEYPGLSPYSVMGDDPISLKDPKGDIFGWDNVITGAIGAVVGGVASVVKSAAANGWDWNKTLSDSKTWEHAGVAAAEGAVIGLTQGASLVATATVNGVITAGGSLIDDKIDHKELNYQKALVKGGAAFFLSAIFNPFEGAVDETKGITRLFIQTPKNILNGAVDYGIDKAYDEREEEAKAEREQAEKSMGRGKRIPRDKATKELYDNSNLPAVEVVGSKSTPVKENNKNGK